MDEGSKRCAKCGETKSLSDFYRLKNGKPRSYCKKCIIADTSHYQREPRPYTGPEVRRCPSCSQDKPLSEFSRLKNNRPNIYCKVCRQRHSAERYAANPARHHAITARWEQKHPGYRRAMNLMKNFGLTPADYDVLLAAQGAVCAICGNPPAEGKFLDVDHCHDTHLIRGLLCRTCNTGIGNLRDDPELVRRALEYLQKPRTRFRVRPSASDRS